MKIQRTFIEKSVGLSVLIATILASLLVIGKDIIGLRPTLAAHVSCDGGEPYETSDNIDFTWNWNNACSLSVPGTLLNQKIDQDASNPFFCNLYDADYFSFTLPAYNTVTVSVTQVATTDFSSSFFVALYDAGQNGLTSNTGFPNASTTYFSTTSQTIYVRVENYGVCEGNFPPYPSSDDSGQEYDYNLSVSFTPSVDLSVSVTDNPDPVNIAEVVTYTVLANYVAGSGNASNVTVNGTAGGGGTIQSVTPSQGTCTNTTTTYNCTLGIVTPSDATIDVAVLAPLTTGMISLNANINSSTNDNIPGNNSTTQNTTVVMPPIPADAYEENDYAGAARLLPGTPISLTVSPSMDQDWFYFFGTADPNPVTIDVLSSYGVNVTLELYGPGSATTPLVSVGPSINPSISYALTTSGYHLIAIKPAVPGVAYYQLNVNMPTAAFTEDVYEQNDTYSGAKTVTIPLGPQVVNIYPANDDDYYRFFADPGTIDVGIFALDSGMSFDVTLYDPSGNPVGAGTVSGTNPSLSEAVTVSGYYILEVIETNGVAGEYQLQIQNPTTTGPIGEDIYEQNDSQATAANLNLNNGFMSISNLTINPASDPDYFRFFGVPGPLSVDLFSSFAGMNFDLNVYAPDGTLVGSGTVSGPNPSLSATLTQTGYYMIEIVETTGTEGYYDLVIDNVIPPTPTPVPTGTAVPTGTPAPTYDPGDMDVAEYNNDFGSAFRVAPGNTISLNFNSGIPGVVDLDYFVMTVKAGVVYTCETYELGLGADTILSIFGPQPSNNNLIGINDDINTQSGNVASKVTWTSGYDGQIYVLVQQNGPVSDPESATYNLTCYTGTVRPGSVTPAPGGGGGGGSTGSTSNEVSVQIVGAPTDVPTPAPQELGVLTVRLLIAYDENENNLIDLSEGVFGMSVRAIDPNINRQIASGFTDEAGSLQLIFTAPENSEILVVIPFLSLGRSFRVGTTADWKVLLPASNLPGLIP